MATNCAERDDASEFSASAYFRTWFRSRSSRGRGRRRRRIRGRRQHQHLATRNVPTKNNHGAAQKKAMALGGHALPVPVRGPFYVQGICPSPWQRTSSWVVGATASRTRGPNPDNNIGEANCEQLEEPNKNPEVRSTCCSKQYRHYAIA